MERQVLTDLGLSEGEAEIFLALLGKGQCSVTELAKKTGRHRTHIYDTLEKLVEKGLVSSSKIDNITLFTASDLENLLNFLKAKEESALEIMPALKKIYEQKKSDPEISIFQGKNGFKSVLRDILREGKGYDVFGTGNRFQEIMPDFYEKWRIESSKMKTPVRLITRKSWEVSPREGFQQRFFPENFFSPTATFIYADKVAIFTWSIQAVTLIKNKETASEYKAYFEYLWKTAKA